MTTKISNSEKARLGHNLAEQLLAEYGSDVAGTILAICVSTIIINADTRENFEAYRNTFIECLQHLTYEP